MEKPEPEGHDSLKRQRKDYLRGPYDPRNEGEHLCAKCGWVTIALLPGDFPQELVRTPPPPEGDIWRVAFQCPHCGLMELEGHRVNIP